MTHTRKIVLAAGALLLPLSTVFIIGSGQAWAKKSASPGSVTCSKIAGTLKFSPPLLATATSTSETSTAKTTLTGCVASGGGATPTKGTTTTVAEFSSNGCAAVLEAAGKPTTLTTKWTPGTIEPTVTTFPAPKSTTTPITISYGGAGTSGTGSYTSSDKGAGSTATIDISGTETSIEATCESKKGLKSLTIDGGSATVK